MLTLVKNHGVVYLSPFNMLTGRNWEMTKPSALQALCKRLDNLGLQHMEEKDAGGSLYCFSQKHWAIQSNLKLKLKENIEIEKLFLTKVT